MLGLFFIFVHFKTAEFIFGIFLGFIKKNTNPFVDTLT